MRLRILALLLVFSIVPSTMEIVEAAVHWVEHGDSAHADSAHESSALGTDEHGCSGTFHLCGCHTVSVLTPVIVADLNAFSSLAHEARLAPASRPGEGASAPPIRPPIA